MHPGAHRERRVRGDRAAAPLVYTWGWEPGPWPERGTAGLVDVENELEPEAGGTLCGSPIAASPVARRSSRTRRDGSTTWAGSRSRLRRRSGRDPWLATKRRQK